MKRIATWSIFTVALMLFVAARADSKNSTGSLTIDYPLDGSIFPPDLAPPTFLWRDEDPNVTNWTIEVIFAGGGAPVRVNAAGERMQLGPIDPRCVGAVLPSLTPEQAAAHTWKPDAQTWATIKGRSAAVGARLTITGFADQARKHAVSSGQISIQTSKDPVGAPIFYRDVPLIPTAAEKGIIQPLPHSAIGLIAWRLRNVSEPQSKVIMQGLPTCANCHSFALDGKTLGLDMDGPMNDKGLYALVKVQKDMTIRNEDVIRWGASPGAAPVKTDGPMAKRFGFMSTVSPDGQYVVTTIGPTVKGVRAVDGMTIGLADRFFNAGYKDYTFGQVFYPTRGILAWYSRASGKLQPLPGADDPRYVQTNAVWSPDGKYLVFARAEAVDSYQPGQKASEYANSPDETQIQYDLYRIPFNSGKGGVAERIEGASQNGHSNSFPKVSPDGKWIVFVQAHTGLLMRPDSQLFIVPSGGGPARRLRANMWRMNSWHSFAPNGRWLVFSSKARSPHTQMYLTHIDENGNDSPAILIEDSTAANRAVNIPEFVNIAPQGLGKIDTPATEFYRLFDVASELGDKKEYEAAIATWKEALALSPDDSKAHSNLGVLLARVGRSDEAVAQYKKAIEYGPDEPDGYTNMGIAMARAGKLDVSIPYLEKAVQLSPWDPKVHSNLGAALAVSGKGDTIAECEKALQLNPKDGEAYANLAIALAKAGRLDDAIAGFEKALTLEADSADIEANLASALLEKGRLDDAIPHLEKALAANPNSAQLNFYLGRTLASVGKFEEAIPHLERAVAATGDPSIGGTLAAVYAQVGRLSEALEAARRSLQVAQQQNQQELVQVLKQSVASYEAAQRGGGVKQ